jgi:DNA-binding response OmpR family regulator
MEIRQKILIAEDDPSIQKLYSIVLKKAGYDVEISPDGRTLYETLKRLPSLFILDKQLAGYNGLDVCRYLKSKETTRDIPVIMISATPDIGSLAVKAGAEDFLEKPFSAKILLGKIQKWINRTVQRSGFNVQRASSAPGRFPR